MELKKQLLQQLLQQLQKDLDALVHTAQVAKEAATSEESKAENKYDTRGLEASYLAGAQAKRADELKTGIHKLSQLALRDFKPDEKIFLTALIEVLINEESKKNFLLLPGAGGSKLAVNKTEYQVITPESVVGQSLMGKNQNDVVEIKINNKTFEYEILKIQ